MLVYYKTKVEVDSVANKLGCLRYYSDSGSDEEKEKALNAWFEGKYRVMVATSALGTGIDDSHIPVILHIGAPESVVDFVQEIGRGGRSGRGCISRVILPKG